MDENLFFISSKTKNIYILNMRSSEITILKTKLIQCKWSIRKKYYQKILFERNILQGLKRFY